jgi:hypothetical protein
MLLAIQLFYGIRRIKRFFFLPVSGVVRLGRNFQDNSRIPYSNISSAFEGLSERDILPLLCVL